MAYTYILRCADNTLYTGWTTDLLQRYRTHNAGKGARYTRTRRPVELVYAAWFPKRQDAMREEYRIKQLTRQQKEQLIAGDGNALHRLLYDNTAKEQEDIHG